MNVIVHSGVGHKGDPPGRGSGRYAWGTGKRPNQRSGIKGYRARKQAEKERAAKLKAAEEKRKQEEAQRQHDADRERVLREGNATEVLQYIDEIPYERMKQISERIKWKAELESYAQKETKSGWDTIDGVMQKVRMVSDWTETGFKVINNLNRINKALGGEIVGGDSKKEKKDK